MNWRNYFKQISMIPRESGNMEGISLYITNRADAHQYTWKKDDAGNICVYVPGKHGESLCVQSHMDMVCVKELGNETDFSRDPIHWEEKDGWMVAHGTTLGADNGIGMAIMMALTHEEHRPSLELLFTVDEEVGLNGAVALDESLLSSSYIINLDTEDEGEICIASAGGSRLIVQKEVEEKEYSGEWRTVTIEGYKGGHSGVEIDKNLGHPSYSLLSFLDQYPDLVVSRFQSGFADNAIPASVTCECLVSDRALFDRDLGEFLAHEEETYNAYPVCHIETTEGTKKGVSISTFRPFVETQCGIYAMSEKIAGLVQTSVNLGVITYENGKIVAQYSTRSSLITDLQLLNSTILERFQTYGYHARQKNIYPGWEQDPQSRLVRETVEVMCRVLGYEPRLLAYHAGLECGAIVGKIPGASAVSFGPTIRSPHSSAERCEVITVDRCYMIVTELCKRFVKI